MALGSVNPAVAAFMALSMRSCSDEVGRRDRADRNSRSTMAPSVSLRAIAWAATLDSERSFSLIVVPLAKWSAWAIDGSAERSHEQVAIRAGRPNERELRGETDVAERLAREAGRVPPDAREVDRASRRIGGIVTALKEEQRHVDPERRAVPDGDADRRVGAELMVDHVERVPRRGVAERDRPEHIVEPERRAPLARRAGVRRLEVEAGARILRRVEAAEVERGGGVAGGVRWASGERCRGREGEGHEGAGAHRARD